MNIFTVHLKGSAASLATLEHSIFIREGFSWAAFVFGPLWLLWRRLWVAFSLAAALEAALVMWIAFGDPALSAAAALQGILHLALGFEAAPLLRAALARRGFEPVGLAQGRRRVDAETNYFRQASARLESGPETVATYPVRTRSPDMVGLFPSAGA